MRYTELAYGDARSGGGSQVLFLAYKGYVGRSSHVSTMLYYFKKQCQMPWIDIRKYLCHTLMYLRRLIECGPMACL